MRIVSMRIIASPWRRVRDGPDLPMDRAAGQDGGVRLPHQRRRSRRAQAAIVVALGFGGVLGALGRYGLSLALPSGPAQFPWGIFLINVSGSALLGFLLIVLMEQFPRGRLARPVIGTGVLGAYTTFSTYVVGAVLLARAGHLATALTYVLASAAAGLLAVWSGMAGARAVIRAERWLQEEL